jgi:FADH2-dependent halogenase
MASVIKKPVLIIGGGPGGTCTSLFLHKLGIDSVIVEKERFPRYHIGESFTGETGGQLRKLDMGPILDKFEYPVKMGTKVIGTGGKNSFYIPVMFRDENNKLQATTTWQARRSHFDQLLWDTAIARGTETLSGECVAVLRDGQRIAGVSCRTSDGAMVEVLADVIVDASGQATFLANRGFTSPKERGNYDRQVAIFSQVVGAVRDEGERRDDTLIFYEKKNHWAWFIPLDKEVVSIGVVTPSEYFTSRKLSKMEFLNEKMQTLNPDLTKRVTNVKFVEEARGTSNYSYYVRRFTGKNFLCVGDSHRFIDPIFSLGLLFATKEAEFSSEAIADYISGKTSHLDGPFAEYERYVDRGQDIIQTLLDCFWEFPLAFQRFAHSTHRDEIIDIFAGRVYGEHVHQYDSIQRMRRALDKAGIDPRGVAVARPQPASASAD